MAIPDLLWACPACGKDRGISREDGVCTGCGTGFTRGPGASIEAVSPQGDRTRRQASAWLAELPDPSSLLGEDPIRSARVEIRPVTGEARVVGESGFLNRAEVFGDRVPGRLTLEPDRLRVERSAGEREAEWPLETLTAVQASSSSLQLKRRGHALVAFYFEDDAIYLWEQLLRAALRDFYGRTGRGEILEFQPRIATRRTT